MVFFSLLLTFTTSRQWVIVIDNDMGIDKPKEGASVSVFVYYTLYK